MQAREPACPAPHHPRSASPASRFFEEAGRSLVIVGAFIGFAMAAAAGLGSAGAWPGARSSPYPAGVSDPLLHDPTPALWLVDGFNVLHVALLGGSSRDDWWTAEQRARVLALAHRLRARGEAVRVVFDGPRPLATPAVDAGGAAAGAKWASPGRPDGHWDGQLDVVFAPSADAWLLARVREAPDPARVAVVTADRRLADRVRHRGARVIPPGAFVERCRGCAPGPEAQGPS